MFDVGWETFHEQARGRWPNEAFVRFAMKTYGAVPDRSAVRFLELGCGAGAQVAFLAEEGFDVTGVDGSDDAIRGALGLMERRSAKKPAFFLRRDICDLEEVFGPRSHQRFDCILDICTLQHLPDPDAAAIIAKARGWLKPGGRFFSVMLSDARDARLYNFPAPVFARNYDDIAGLFAGWSPSTGHQLEERPDGIDIAHWIIEAQVTT